MDSRHNFLSRDIPRPWVTLYTEGSITRIHISPSGLSKHIRVLKGQMVLFLASPKTTLNAESFVSMANSQAWIRHLDERRMEFVQDNTGVGPNDYVFRNVLSQSQDHQDDGKRRMHRRHRWFYS